MMPSSLNPIQATSKAGIIKPALRRNLRYDSWLHLVLRHPASPPNRTQPSSGMVDDALHSQHILSALFHCGNLKSSQYQAQSPLIWHRLPLHPFASNPPPPSSGRPAWSSVGALPESNALKLQLSTSIIAFIVPSAMSVFLITVATKRFWTVVPLPMREFHDIVYTESWCEKDAPSP